MDIQSLDFKRKYDSDKYNAFIVLHGISKNFDNDPFIQNIFSSLVENGQSVVAPNFPYSTNDKKPSKDLVEEAEVVDILAEHLVNMGYKKITLIGKSLGAIAASRWLRDYEPSADISLNILGYVIGSVETPSLKDKLNLVIVGQNDPYGDAAAVNKELSEHGVSAKVIEIAGGDHSYRDKNGEPTHQQEVVDILIKNLVPGTELIT